MGQRAMSGYGVFAVHAACVRGVEAVPVTVEVSMADGLPGIAIVGMADSSVLEARGRIRCALRSAGYSVPRKSITVNLAPGDMRKTGSGLDLPIAVAILAASHQIPARGIDRCLFVGELALDGSVCPVRGEVAYQMLARERGLALVSPQADTHVHIEGIEHGCLAHLGPLRAGIDEAVSAARQPPESSTAPDETLDFSDVVGQEVAKRGMVIAAAGELGLLMVGSPGSGKTMLARRMTSILPAIDERARQEALCIHSVCGEDLRGLLAGTRPFRSPHHSISAAGLVGGGRPVRPGEISLAHGGVLFLDELSEFPSNVLQTLRQPMEAGSVRIVRVEGAYTFPARFQLLAASNPCPCGYLGDREVPCTCAPSAIQRYRAKLAGPLADRIDISIDVFRPDPEAIVRGAQGMGSAEMRALVEAGRAYRRSRESAHAACHDIRGTDGAIAAFDLDEDAGETLVALARGSHLTGRAMIRLCRIARTIADIAQEALVRRDHILEASMFRRSSDDEA